MIGVANVANIAETTKPSEIGRYPIFIAEQDEPCIGMLSSRYLSAFDDHFGGVIPPHGIQRNLD